MKVMFPKNIRKGIFATMSFQIGPLTISLIQLFILAIGIAVSLGAYNAFAQTSKAVGLIIAIPVFIIFVIVAFFKISELGLIPFVAKLIKTHLFDTTRKFQVNYEKPNDTDRLLKEVQASDTKKIINTKSSSLSHEIVENIEKGGLV